jgi:hypothetical protein
MELPSGCEYGQDCVPDIAFVTLRSYEGGVGRRMLAITVGTYELFGGLVEVANIKVRFDARGDPGVDWCAILALANRAYDIGWTCGRRFGAERYRLRVHDDSMTCFIPERDLHPTKPIRFQALSRVNQSVADRAPDQGWADI